MERLRGGETGVEVEGRRLVGGEVKRSIVSTYRRRLRGLGRGRGGASVGWGF